MIRQFRLAKRICIFLAVCLLTSAARILPVPVKAATFTVNTLTDTNGSCTKTHCSLREAITKANEAPGDDLIGFSIDGTILINSTLPDILGGGKITIDGSSRSLAVSGQSLHRIFYVPAGSNLALRNLTLTDGHTTTSGGAIYSRGELTLESVTIQDCYAEDYGGAIDTEANTKIVDSTFTGNSTGIADGGALYVRDGTTEISNGTFKDNVANYAGGAIASYYAGEYDQGVLIIENTLFQQNTAFGGYGGAIANRGSLEVTQSRFLLNSAEDGGGAFCNFSGDYLIKDSDFAFNEAVFGSGGAIYITNARDDRSHRIEGSRILFNFADDNGGGFYVNDGLLVLNQTTLSENSAKGNGGGGYILRGYVIILADIIEHNSADLDGGALYNVYGNLSIRTSLLKDNRADGKGGGVYYSADSEISSIQNCTLYSNSANKGGGVYNLGRLYLINDTLSKNSAATGEGGGLNASIDTWIYNTIVANNLSGGNCASTGWGQDFGNNLDSGSTCKFRTEKGSLSNTDPLLGTLSDHDSSSDALMPQTGSPAIDGVTNPEPNRCPEIDQRGYSRPFGIYCDIGAVEAYVRLHLPLILR